jgi:uncharacterized caspase-like protein
MARKIGSWALALLMATAVTFGFAQMPASAQSRVALVIGNSAYRNVPALPNPTRDATAVADALGRLGFSTQRLTDASFDDMRRALIEFGAKARGADMAVIFYAGHGMEVGGENWLIPTDAQLRSDADTANEAIGLKSAMLAVSGTKELGLVIMDACRNNPFVAKMQHTGQTRAVSRGLAAVDPADNVLVAYAAKDGTTAQDGDRLHSPFTAALLKYIETPGLEINFLFRNVRDDVLTATQRQQQPFVYGSLPGHAIYLKLPESADEQTWSVVETTSDISLLRRFIEQFPVSAHVGEAKARIAALEAATGPARAPLLIPCPAGKARIADQCVLQSAAKKTTCLRGVWYRPGTPCARLSTE